MTMRKPYEPSPSTVTFMGLRLSGSRPQLVQELPPSRVIHNSTRATPDGPTDSTSYSSSKVGEFTRRFSSFAASSFEAPPRVSAGPESVTAGLLADRRAAL